MRITMKNLAVTVCTSTLLAIPAFAQQSIKIGHISALTGTYAFVGKPVSNGVLLAAEELNNANYFGTAKIELLNEDNGSDRGQAVTLFTRMATRNRVQMVLGPISSQEALAVAPVANNLSTPMMTVAYSPDVLKAGPWSFKVSGLAQTPLVTLGKYVAEKSGTKRCFLISIRDNDGYVRQKDSFRDALKASGGEVLADETVLSSESDFTAIATKAVAAKPDCLFVNAPAEQAANIVIQTKQAGMPESVKLFSSNTVASPKYLSSGGKAVDGTIFVADYSPAGVNDLAKSFAQNYQRKFGEQPDNWAAMGYSLMMVAGKGIKDAGGASASREQIRTALGQIRDFPVVIGRGTYSIDAERVPQYGAVIMQYRAGAAVVVAN